jgi:hypothetical protein
VRARLGEPTAAKEEFEAPHAKTSGRSEGYRSITEPVGGDFSDLIGGGLRELAEKAVQETAPEFRDLVNGCIRDFQERYEEGLDEEWQKK